MSDKIFLERLEGELILKEDMIVWSYDLDKDSEEIENINDELEESDVEFGDIVCVEEVLNDTYESDMEEIYDTICSVDDINDWYFSEPVINDTIISFDIR